MNSNTVKAFIKRHLALPVRVTTTPTKHRWITAWIQGERAGNSYVYSHSFPENFRRICMKTVYPNSPVGDQAAGGNISGHSIAMLPHEWQSAIETYEQTKTHTDTKTASPALAG